MNLQLTRMLVYSSELRDEPINKLTSKVIEHASIDRK